MAMLSILISSGQVIGYQSLEAKWKTSYYQNSQTWLDFVRKFHNRGRKFRPTIDMIQSGLLSLSLTSLNLVQSSLLRIKLTIVDLI